MQDGPPDDGPGAPTTGDPVGGHRVLEPRAALPAVATRLDPRPDLWDREVRVELTDIVLDAQDHLRLQRRAAGDPGRMRAGLLEAAAERGGLPLELAGTAFVGRIAARGRSAPPGPEVGDRVAVAAPTTAVPLWLHDVSGWTGGRRIPVAGHATAAPRTPLLPVPDDVPAEVAVALADVAHVPAAVRVSGIERRTRVLVTGPTRVAGAVALLVAAELGARLAAVVTDLHGGRLVRGIGAGDPVIVAPADTRDGVAAVMESLAGPASVVLVADDDRDVGRLAAATVATDGLLSVLVPGVDLDGLQLDASGVGCSPSIALARRLQDGTEELLRLWREHDAFRALVAWRSGLAPAPEGASITGDDPDPEDT